MKISQGSKNIPLDETMPSPGGRIGDGLPATGHASSGPHPHEELQATARAIIECINRRQNLYSSNPLFQQVIDPNFCSMPNPPWPQTPVDFESWLARQRVAHEMNPKLNTKILSLDVTINDIASAEVDADAEISGMFAGLSKSRMIVFRFRRRLNGDSTWRCYNIDMVDGMGQDLFS